MRPSPPRHRRKLTPRPSSSTPCIPPPTALTRARELALIKEFITEIDATYPNVPIVVAGEKNYNPLVMAETLTAIAEFHHALTRSFDEEDVRCIIMSEAAGTPPVVSPGITLLKKDMVLYVTFFESFLRKNRVAFAENFVTLPSVHATAEDAINILCEELRNLEAVYCEEPDELASESKIAAAAMPHVSGKKYGRRDDAAVATMTAAMRGGVDFFNHPNYDFTGRPRRVMVADGFESSNREFARMLEIYSDRLGSPGTRWRGPFHNVPEGMDVRMDNPNARQDHRAEAQSPVRR